MGITISSKNNSCDMGYGGFMRFRIQVAKMVSDKFGNHYADLNNAPYIDTERKMFFEKYDAKTKEFVSNGYVTSEIANFCYQADVEGSVDKKQAKEIYKLIKDCDDSLSYGYSGRSDCATMKDLKQIFEDCTHYCKKVKWF